MFVSCLLALFVDWCLLIVVCYVFVCSLFVWLSVVVYFVVNSLAFCYVIVLRLFVVVCYVFVCVIGCLLCVLFVCLLCAEFCALRAC